jgi:hypothetical protein
MFIFTQQFFFFNKSSFKYFQCCKFKEMIVIENFKVENSVLRLDRDVYLSIVKFLKSLTVNKV